MNKKWYLIAMLFGFFLTLTFVSCEKTQIKDKDVISETDKGVLKDLLNVKSSLEKFKSKESIFGASNSFKKSFAKMKKVEAKKAAIKGDSTDIDSTDWDDWNDWDDFTSCATITEYTDDDGNFVSVCDYGTEGCEEWGELTKGKITYIWNESEEQNQYYSKVIYEDFYSYGMLMDGYSEYTFTFSDSGNTENDMFWNFSGNASCKEEITMSFDDGETFSYSANYSDKWDNDTYTVLEGYFTYKSDDYEFSYEVAKELIYNYACESEEIWIVVPVLGIEVIKYTENWVTEEFSIDYGDGTCDNLAIITKDGESEEVDFGDYWEDEWNDDGEVIYDTIP